MRSRRRLLAALLVVAACGRSGSTAPDPAVSAITLSATSISFSSLLATFDVTATVLGGDGSPMSNASVTWTSQDPRVATVSSNGRVAAVGNGTTRVTASVSGVDASATVEVQQLPVSIALAPDPLVLAGPLDTASVRATVADAGGSAIVPVTVSWTTLDDGVATVGDSGLVTGVATGQTTITAGVATSGAPLTRDVTVSVGGLALITTRSLPSGLVGSGYSQTLSAVGGDGSYVWTLVSGSVPPGLSLASDGTISGTPTTVGSSSFTVEVTSDDQTDTQALTIDILGSVLLGTSYLVGGNPGMSYSDRIAPARGGDGSYTYVVSAGRLPDGLSLSSATGAVTGMPTTPGVSFFEVTASSAGQAAAATYAITISTVAADAFNLWVSFDGGPLPPTNAVEALNGALARWEEVVIGDVGDVTYPPSGLTPSTCSLVDASILNGAFIEDVVLVLAIAPFDGRGKTLARGGPCGYGRRSLPAVISGQIELDEADIDAASSRYLQSVIWHEIAHAMGVGTLWSGSLTGSGTPLPRYVGTNGNAEWRALGGAFDGVPVQPDVEAHWDEAWFDGEIMTPTTEGPAGTTPISRITIGTLIDLGWTAELSAADVYRLPDCSGSCPATAPGTVEPFDIVVVDPLLPLVR